LVWSLAPNQLRDKPMTKLGYNKTIMERFAEIKEMSDNLVEMMGETNCPVMCPAIERYDTEHTYQTEDQLVEEYKQDVLNK
jgi:hypothetical protein